MEELWQQDSEVMGLNSTRYGYKGDKGVYPQNLQGHHNILMICSFWVPPADENWDISQYHWYLLKLGHQNQKEYQLKHLSTQSILSLRKQTHWLHIL